MIDNPMTKPERSPVSSGKSTANPEKMINPPMTMRARIPLTENVILTTYNG
jgi:hypothetical protein